MLAEFEDVDDVGLGEVAAGAALVAEDGDPGNGEVEEGAEFGGVEALPTHTVKRFPHAHAQLLLFLFLLLLNSCLMSTVPC